MISTRFGVTLMALLSLSGAGRATTAQTASPLQLRFEENRGQAATDVQYVARGRGQTVFFSDTGVRVQWPAPDGGAAAVRMSFPGSSRPAAWQPVSPVGFVSYFLGADESQWVRGAPHFERLRRNLYPGVDVVFYGQDNLLEYDLVLAPGADPAQVRVRFEGMDSLRMAADGGIELTLAGGTLRQRTPVIYQERAGAREPVNGHFVQAGSGEFRLEIGEYDAALPLTVDPVLESATYLGGEGEDTVTFVNDEFIGGTTNSVAFYGVVPQARRSRDIFIRYRSRYNNTAFLTIIGGSGDDEIAGAGTDGRGVNFFVAGTTSSRDFPRGNRGEYLGGKSDGFLLHLQSTGQFGALTLMSTVFIGGTGEDRVQSMAYLSSVPYLTGVTDSPDMPVQRAFQSSIRGGKDAFLAVFNFLTLTVSSYLGGSGDDEATSIVRCGPHVCIGGETRSSDFPLEGPGRRDLRGASDAFIATVDFAPISGATVVASALIGGGGEDRINALAGNYQPIAATGTTTSADFPTLNPLQSRFGGESDAFLLTLDSLTGDVGFSSVIGGSAMERGSAIALNANGDLFLGGSTRSTDLPVLEAFQPNPAGGEDGFYAVIGNDRQLKQLTYFGGSGDDRINSLGIALGQPTAGGQTTSSDLPLQTPSQDRKDGASDGFTAVIGTAYISGPNQVTLGMGLAVHLTMGAGQSKRSPLTLRVSDLSKLQILTSHGPVSELVSGSWEFTLQAIADSGDVEVVASAPGFLSKTFKVRLYPSVATPTLKPVTEMTTLSYPLPLDYQLVAFDVQAKRLIGGGSLLAGVAAPKATWSVSDESVLRLQESDTQVLATPVAPGSVQLSLKVAGFSTWPPEPVTVNIRRPQLSIKNVGAAQDLICPLSVSVLGTSATRLGSKPSLITFRSLDPTRLLLSESPTEAGQESTTAPLESWNLNPTVYAHALANSGEARLLITSPDIEAPLEATVLLSNPSVQFNSLTYNVGTGSGLGIILGLAPARNAVQASCTARPGQPPLQVRLVSSDPSVALFEPPTVTYSTSNTLASLIRGVAVGTAMVTAQAESANFRPSEPATVIVFKSAPPPPTVTPEVKVGKDLQVSTSVTAQGVTGEVEAVVTVDDPSLALVASEVTSSGSAEIRKRYQGRLEFQVQGLQAKGQTRIRVRIAGAPEIVRVVTLAPSGFAFNRDSVTQNMATTGQASVGAWLLDEVTGIPLLSQSLRPGLSAQLTVRKEQGNAITFNTTTVSFSGDGQSLQSVVWNAQSAGEATLSFDQPQGFTPPSRMTRLRIRVSTDSFSLAQAYTVAKDGVLEVAISSPVASFTVTSADPSRVLVSSKPGETGSASATIVRGQPVYVHGLNDHGLVPIRVSAPNVEDAESTIILSSIMLQLAGFPSGPVSALAYASPATGTVGLIADNGAPMMVRPGVSPIRVDLVSSDPRVVSVRPAYVELRSGSGKTAESFAVNFEGSGEAEIRVRIPAGYTINRDGISFSVRAPRLVLPEGLVLGKTYKWT